MNGKQLEQLRSHKQAPISDKEFDNLLDEGFVVDKEIDEHELEQRLIEASR